jgi:hypothetical protein
MTDINPLNVLNQREVEQKPEHFTVIDYKVPMDRATSSTTKLVEYIRSWIFNNLDGRFFVANLGLSGMPNGNEIDYDEVHYLIKIGFEIPEESTFFSLAFHQ